MRSKSTETLHFLLIQLYYVYLIDILPLGILVPDAEPDDIILISIEEVETKTAGEGASHPDAVVCPLSNESEECGETLQTGVVGTPA